MKLNVLFDFINRIRLMKKYDSRIFNFMLKCLDGRIVHFSSVNGITLLLQYKQ